MTAAAPSGIFVRAWGDRNPQRAGRPIVLVHGLGMSSRYMVGLGERLAAEHRVFAPDLPGFGRSARRAGHLSIPAQANVLGEWLRANGIRDAVLLGHSYGCQVVSQFAADATPSTIVSALVLVAPTVDAGGRSAIAEVGRLLRDVPREPMSLIALATRSYLRAGPVRVLKTLRDAVADRIEDNVQRAAVPMLFIRGENDPLVSDRWIRQLAERAGKSLVVTVPGAAHAVNYSRAPEVARLVDDFSRRLDRLR